MSKIEERLINKYLKNFDIALTGLMALTGVKLLRIGLGIVFFWFGMLKFFPGVSPAEQLVVSTVTFIDPAIFLPVLALWESVIGLGLITGKFMRLTLFLLFMQMPGTALPLVMVPEAVWTSFPFALTLEGQYIFKNLVIIGGGIVLGGTVRGGKVIPE